MSYLSLTWLKFRVYKNSHATLDFSMFQELAQLRLKQAKAGYQNKGYLERMGFKK
jgi:hypothetical protein